ncbi:MAG: PQQ-dependent sugar dehydrogenase [Bacteroidota bacterium]|nr:PQQ-dependent sugar dehydrogenase [Bacteroidota bacterium]
MKTIRLFFNYIFQVFFFLLAIDNIGATLPNGFIETRIAQNLNPTDIEFSPDGRLFLCDKSGIVTIYKNGNWLSKPFLSITGIVDDGNERGLQSIAFDPNFTVNGYVYVYYTHQGTTNNGTPINTNSYNRVNRYTALNDTAIMASQTSIIGFNYLSNAGNHNGGGMVFGADGKLYIATGENANTSNSQSSATLLGKIVRINPDGTIPTDNPYYNTFTGINRAIYNLGLRNPFKMAIQPSTGTIFVNDVGQSSWEEINRVVANKNFGWPGIEGVRVAQTMPANYSDPVFAYDHSQGCSITAGTFYNPPVAQFPSSFTGKYLYADYCNSYIRILDHIAGTVSGFITGINRPLDVAIDNQGSLFYIARAGLGGGSNTDNTSSSNGEIWKVQYTGNGNVGFAVQPVGYSVPNGTSVTFAASANGNQPIYYQWYRNNVSIAGANSNLYTITTTSLSDNGAQFKVVINNLFSTLTSNIAVLTINPNTLPEPIIIAPGTTTSFVGGQNISFSGFATDVEDGTLSGSAFSWRIDLHHDTHTHPALDPSPGSKSGTYIFPNIGETSDNIWLRIYLKVTDQLGASKEIYRDIFPQKVDVKLKSNIAGIQLFLDGATVITPFKFTNVIGMQREIKAQTLVNVSNKNYSFTGWTHGGSATQLIYPLASDTSFTANYIEIVSVNTPVGINTTSGLNTLTSINIQYISDEDLWHPNPSNSGIFTIINLHEQIEILRISTIQGKEIPISYKNNQIDIHEYPKGIYIVDYLSGHKKYQSRIIYR